MCFFLQIITSSGFGFFIFHKLIQVVFPSFGWSSFSPLSLCRYDKPRIPLIGFSGPSVWALGGDPQGLSPFQFLLCFKPTCDVVCQHFFISFFRASFCVFLACLVVLIMCAVFFLSIFACFVVAKFFFSFFVFSFCLDDQSERSALGSAEHFFVFFCSSPCSGNVRFVGATTESNRCDRCRRSGIGMSVPVDVLRTRTKRIGSCAAPPWFPGPRLYVFICPKYFTFPSRRRYLDMHLVDLDFSQLVCFLVCQNFLLLSVNFEPLRFCTFF